MSLCRDNMSIFHITARKELETARAALLQGDYMQSLQSLNLILNYVRSYDIDKPSDLEDLLTQTYRLGIEEELRFANSALDRNNYLLALSSLSKVRTFSGCIEKSLPEGFAQLEHHAYELGIKTETKNAYILYAQDKYPEMLHTIKKVLYFHEKIRKPFSPEISNLMASFIRSDYYQGILKFDHDDFVHKSITDAVKDILDMFIATDNYHIFGNLFTRQYSK